MHQVRNSPAAIVAAIMQEAFASPALKVIRSPEYRAGAQARLLQLLIGKPFACPFAEGTPHADAFFVGADEGTNLFYSNGLQRSGLSPLDPYAGLKGHDYIKARSLNPPVQRVQTYALDRQDSGASSK